LIQLTSESYLCQPWKNGGGTTLEIAREDLEGRMLWRVSIATVASSGPFSDFSGYRRTILLLSGAGMVLGFDGVPPQRLDRPHVPFEFDGGASVHGELIDGPVEDFNLMVDAVRATGTLDVLDLGAAQLTVAPDHDTALLFALSGAVRVDADGHRYDLAERESLRLDRDASMPARVALSCAAIGAAAKVALIGIDRVQPCGN
ncbi:MAG: HutD family protein, partial [Betaproteobacteria bacterium]|nr:HutD family protein [Betaproteobacteria bacterium]